MREQPKQSAKVVVQLAEGDFLEGTGEKSPTKEIATLRGVEWNEPYHKVVSTTPEQYTGWAFGGGLATVYAGSRANSPDLGSLVQFSSFLKALNTKQLESGGKAWNYVKTNLANANGSLADATFILLNKFMARMEREGDFYKITEAIDWSSEEYEAVWKNTFDMNKYPGTKSLAANGFALTEAEGMVFPVADWGQMQSFFGSKLTPSMKSYLDQEVIEQRDPASSDGGIVIEMNELADRAYFWEKFNRENPYFIESGTQESERWARFSLMAGENNTPIYNFETMAISEESKKVWAYIQQKYSGSQLAATAKEISDLCAAEGWKYTDKIKNWQAQFVKAQGY